MGSIHERLNGLQEARDLERDTIKAEGEELDAKKKAKSSAEMLGARREQYGKLMVLQQAGILDMITDATDGLEIKPEWPLSQEEIREKARQRHEEWERRISENQKLHSAGDVLVKDFDLRTAQEDRLRELKETGKINEYNREAGNDYWWYEMPNPVVTNDLSWDTGVTINVIKRHQGFSFHGEKRKEDVGKISIHFDGDKLILAGAEEVYNGFIPQNVSGKEALEDAFVAVFDKPKDIHIKPNIPDHTHPRTFYSG